jgi:hypothetical protein
MVTVMVAAGPNCDWMRSPGATDPSMPDGQAAKSSGRQTMRTPSCVSSAKPDQSGKGSIERRDRQIDEGTDQTAGAFRPDRIVKPFDCPADRSSLRKAAITRSWSARFAESPAWSPLSDLP